MLKKLHIFLLVSLLLVNISFAMNFTEITDNNSFFVGNVTAYQFYEDDGTYVIPIYKVNWSQGTGDLSGYGINATVNYDNLDYLINSYWQNITNFPENLSFFYNDVGYITNANLTLYENVSQFINDRGYINSSYLIWNNILNKPTAISYWDNDVGYITMVNLTELYQQIQILNLSLQNESLIRNQTDESLLIIMGFLADDIDNLNDTKSGIGYCPFGYVVQNLTSGQPECIQILSFETDPVFIANNVSIWNAINNKLSLTDQRYNETSLLLDINNTLNQEILDRQAYDITSINSYNTTNTSTIILFRGDGTNISTTFLTLQGEKGEDGTDGVDGVNGTDGIDGINGTSVTMSNVIDNLDGTFTWVFSDGYNFTTSNLTGEQGIQGIQGIAGQDGVNGTNGVDGINGTSVTMSNVIDNLDGTFTWVFSDGYNFTTSNLTGEQGIQGIQGIAGQDGVNGTDGVDGIDGINGTSVTMSNVIDNLDGTFTWVFSDGYNFTTSNLTGQQGIQGIQGIQGVAGVDGVNGTDGVDGVNGTTLVIGDNIYTYNTTDIGGEIIINFNETQLNNTIDERYDVQIGQLSKIYQGIDVVGNMKITNVPQAINLTYDTIKDDYYSHSTTINPSEVTILQEGWYKITAMTTIKTDSASGGIRGNPVMHLDIWNGTTWVQQPDNMGGYTREDATYSLSTSITGVGVFEFEANTSIRISVYDTVAVEPDESTVAFSSRLLLEYIDRDGTTGGNISNLKDVGDVSANAPNDGDILIFNGTTSQWTSVAFPISSVSYEDTKWNTDQTEYLYNDSTNIYFNETKLNETIYEQTGIFEENVTISVSGGVGNGITTNCCNGVNEILEIAVFPTSSGNKYRFSANTSITGEVVDSDRKKHTGNWIVGHSGSVVINENVAYYITSADIDESFRVRFRFQK